MGEQTVVFGPGKDYLYHTAYLARTEVMKMALATILTGKLTVASENGGFYKTFVDVARVRPGLVQRSFSDLFPTVFEGGNAAFLPGLNHKYASYRVFGTEDQIARFQTHMKGHLAVLQDFISQEYTPFAEAHINKKATYIVIGEDRLAENKAALGAYFSANPQKTLLIDALQETLSIREHQPPDNVSHLAFSNTRHNLTTVGDGFLIGCTGLTTVELSDLANLTAVGNSFLDNCTGFTAVDLSGLANVTTVGCWFLSRCTGLTTVDLSLLSNVTTVGDDFLRECIGLTEVALSPLAKLTTVSGGFLSGYRRSYTDRLSWVNGRFCRISRKK